jgi:hypothetical protein
MRLIGLDLAAGPAVRSPEGEGAEVSTQVDDFRPDGQMNSHVVFTAKNLLKEGPYIIWTMQWYIKSHLHVIFLREKTFP